MWTGSPRLASSTGASPAPGSHTFLASGQRGVPRKAEVLPSGLQSVEALGCAFVLGPGGGPWLPLLCGAWTPVHTQPSPAVPSTRPEHAPQGPRSRRRWPALPVGCLVPRGGSAPIWHGCVCPPPPVSCCCLSRLLELEACLSACWLFLAACARKAARHPRTGARPQERHRELAYFLISGLTSLTFESLGSTASFLGGSSWR